MEQPQINVIVLGVSCFDGMAGSMRIRNLFEPLINKQLITVHNLIYEKSNRESVDKKGRINDINFKTISYRLINIFSLFGFIFGGMSFIRKNKQKNAKNILYVFDYPDIKNLMFLLYAKITGYKIVLDIVEDNRYEGSVGLINNFRIKTSLFLAKYSRYIASAMIGISDHLYQKLKGISKGRLPVYFIPISVNLNYFKCNDVVSDNQNLQIFYGGSFGLKDGLQHLLKAFDIISTKYPHIKLVLTGAGHKSDMDRFYSQINQLVHKDRVLYKGFLDTDDYYHTLNSCDIFCMTRVNSKFANAGFPFKLGEFLASGKAVVATNVGDVCNYLTNEKNALVINPDSVDEIVQALTTLIENPEKIQILGKEARITAETYFDTEKVSNNLYKIFTSVR